ncbi:hypothetical protein V5O48_015966 [Marasmius crinis-equi]|uniref:Uncharacterized protein n=1 Tax=Marasmius crinis-equi TaxID=585013 RepID=A0ABR3ETA7_9AGAR
MKIHIPEKLRHLFGGRKASSFYSPYLIDNNVTLDALLFAAANRQDDPFGSPLSSAPSSRAPSPEPEDDEPDTVSTANPSPPKPTTDKGMKRAAQDDDDVDLGEQPENKGNEQIQKPPKKSPEERSKGSKARGHANRARKRHKTTAELCSNLDYLLDLAKKHGEQHYKRSAEQECDVDGAVLESRATSTGYVGNAKVELPQKRIYSKDELVDDGKNNFQYIKHRPECTQPISCPKSKKIMALIVPGPRNNPTWLPNCDAATEKIKECRPKCKFPDTDPSRRGGINGVGYGVSLGSGQPEPMLRNDQGVCRKRVMESIRDDPVFQRIAGFLSMTFLTWAPLLFLYYATTMSDLLEHYPHLSLPFPNAIWASFAINFGPQTVCLPHRDSKNLAYGWCAITALGKYNWRLGGHLVLWDRKMVIEFPPGTTIYIPSALVCHFNTAIAADEERYSFTLYSAGGLFRWVEHGFQFEYDYENTPEAAENAHLDKTRWERGRDLFSTVDELRTGLDNVRL